MRSQIRRFGSSEVREFRGSGVLFRAVPRSSAQFRAVPTYIRISNATFTIMYTTNSGK